MKPKLSIYDFLGIAGKNLGKLVRREADFQGVPREQQDTHIPNLVVEVYDREWLLNFLINFRSKEENKSKVDLVVWNTMATKILKHKKALEAQKQPVLF